VADRNIYTRVIVCGGRDGQAYGLTWRALDQFDRDISRIEHLITGSRRGTDGEADSWAIKRERVASTVPALWETGEMALKGRKAAEGPIRNRRMPALFNVHAVLAFPGDRGTADMKYVARELQIPLFVCVTQQSHAPRGQIIWMKDGDHG
jgi:hypothetical protein